MRTPPRSRGDWHAGPLALLAIAAALALVAAGGQSAGRATPGSSPADATSWRGLAGSRPRVTPGQRVIVVLRSPSLAQRVARAGGRVTDRQERAWSSLVVASQRLLITRLSVQGVAIRPEYTFTRTLNGFSAALSPDAIPLLERDDDVAGVFPVRPAYPAAVSTGVLSRADFGPDGGHRPEIGLSGIDGRGVTIALLDTGVDRATPFLRGRVAEGIDIVGGNPNTLAARKPDEPAQLERHGTEMAGLVVGAGGPSGLAGVATGATVLPIRVAGWQPDATGRWAVYSRSDQILAGLERAVDPNDDGDAHDAARIALVALFEPYAAFADSPEARAAAGALALDTLVVASAGNDGAAGPGFGSISGPGGAPAALTVGAVDTRATTETVHVVARSGLRVLLDRTVPLAGAVRPADRLDLEIAVPRGALGPRPEARGLLEFFDPDGTSRVAGRAALVAGGASPQPAAERAARAGASAVLLYPSRTPAGGLGLDEDVPVPVVALPPSAVQALIAALRSGARATISIGNWQTQPNVDLGRVVGFSSTGLAFDGRVKPDLVAAGVGLATADPGANADGSPRYATVNGTSAAAATAAGAAALLAQARPRLGARSLKALLVGTARYLERENITAQGGGLLDVGAAAAGELGASPATLSLGRSTGAGWRVRRDVTINNLSTRTIRVRLSVRQTREGAAPVDFALRPGTLVLSRGGSATVSVRAVTSSAASGTAAPAEGAVVARTVGGGRIRIPWTITFGPRTKNLIGLVQVTDRAFRPSDNLPSQLRMQLGVAEPVGRQQQFHALARLDVELFNDAHENLGLLARLRDVLPGNDTIGLSGRDPRGEVLPPGTYRLRLTAWPTEGGPPTRARIPFTILG